MKSLAKIVAVAAAMVGASMFASAPARADSFGISIGNGGIGFSLSTGGYCDRWGCPDDYWNYPIYYGPVYYGNTWYRGPVYYRVRHGVRYYWVRGGWHRNYYRGPRHHGWHYGPALSRDYYRHHGFRVHERRAIRREIRHERRHDRRVHRREHRREIRHERRHDRREYRRDRRGH
ncbi:MAG TPA: hypothetical protein VFI93_06465 [Rhizomicrobium sp.]|nr:hypothetical protein [Rhizomicrobium sp.]